MKQIRKFLLIFAAVFCIIAPASFAYGASQTYTLTFDSNCNNDSSYTTSITTKAVAQGDSYGVLPAPTRKGYAFDGWYTAATGGTAVSATTTMGSSNATVHAHWTAYTITINYMTDGAQTWRTYPQETKIDCSNLEIAQTEIVAYNEKYPHAQYGVLDVNRLSKKGYKTYNRWQVGAKESTLLVLDTNWEDDRKDTATGKTIAEYLHVDSLLEVGNVVVNLYPVYSLNGTNIANAIDRSFSTAVNAEILPIYALIVPESVTMTGENGTGEKTATIPVTVKGDIGLTQKITVTTTPPIMQQAGASDVTATVTAPKTQWNRTDALANNGDGITSNYTVKATLTPGDWPGTAEFSCSISAF